MKPVDVDERDFELVRIGVGMCVPKDEDHDMVVAADRLDALGLHLTTVQRWVLDAAEAEMAEGRIIASTSTFALFRSPAIMVAANEHRRVNLCYGFCVERTTGKLQVAAWTMAPENKPQKPPSALVRLAATPVYDCQIDVRAKRILGTVPYSWSFALRSLPPGRSLRVAPALGELITTTNRHPDEGDIEELERLLGSACSRLRTPIQRYDERRSHPLIANRDCPADSRPRSVQLLRRSHFPFFAPAPAAVFGSGPGRRR